MPRVAQGGVVALRRSCPRPDGEWSSGWMASSVMED